MTEKKKILLVTPLGPVTLKAVDNVAAKGGKEIKRYIVITSKEEVGFFRTRLEVEVLTSGHVRMSTPAGEAGERPKKLVCGPQMGQRGEVVVDRVTGAIADRTGGSGWVEASSGVGRADASEG